MTDADALDLDAISDVVVRGRYVNQRMAVVPMEPNCVRRGARRRRPADVLRLQPDAPRPAGSARRGARHRRRRRPRDRARRSAARSAASRDLRRVLGGRRRSSSPRPTGLVVALPRRRPRLASSLLAARSSTPSSAAATTARSPDCASASSATVARTPASAPSSRPGPSACPTAPTASPPSSSTSSSPSPTPRRWAPTAAPDAPRPRRCSSGSSTTPPTSWRSTRSSCGGATCIADDAFPFATLTGLTYDSGRYATPLDAAAEAVGYDELRREQAARRERGDRVVLGIGVAAYVEITAGGSANEFGAVEVHDDGSATVRAGTFGPRPGPPDVVRHARPRPDGHPDRPHPARRRRHRPRAARRRHGRVAVAAARRVGGPPGDRDCSSRGPNGSPPTSSRPMPPTSSSTSTPARSASPACRPAR